ncbi:carboxypeptidase-like regulatory domain-containing protein [Prolixibacter denitrificans]|uniref:Carboxypeptidase-like protein n=1 Tax=Prolixibacter denitrificans TaxID=1541063 RepID=A0A2P8CL19_9BACT|nr:carboxypeptidase-like regulatory domain-containing protein [Prolixibacter denitrificans]PSK85678.1 carboxypeptidase-like protein [Prolixibacter denitrificans]GET20297.1 hypothetical protein JCM18694_05430 [Prolixibacter denitrificans]
MRHKIAALVIAFFLPGILFAQNKTATIKGIVIDNATGKPVQYANIGIEGTFLGSASNASGQFEFNVPASEKNGYLYASAVGYETVKRAVSSINSSESIVLKMEPQSYKIEDVDISAQSLVLYRILREASQKISDNYLLGPLSSQAYYRNDITENGKLIHHREAAVEISDKTGYVKETPAQEQKDINYRFMEVRTNVPVSSLADGMTQMDELLSYDIVRNSSGVLNNKFLHDYDLTLDKVTQLDGDSIWVINYTLNHPDISHTGDFYVTAYKGKIYISKKNYAVVKNETWVTASNYSRQGRSFAVTGKSNLKPVEIHYNFTTSYRKNGNKYTLGFTKATRQNVWLNTQTHNKRTVVYQTYLLPSVIETVHPNMLSEREYFVNKPYNKAFWDSFNSMVQ